MPTMTILTNLPTPKHQIRGAQNKAQGDLFEQQISAECRELARTGRAYIEKTPEPMRVTRSLGAGLFQAHFTAKAQPDYKGTLAGGRAVCFEAKTATGGKISRDRVTPEQLEALELHESLGAWSFVLIWMDFHKLYLVPTRVWRDMKSIYGRKYMDEHQLEPFAVRDIADALEQMEREAPPC